MEAILKFKIIGVPETQKAKQTARLSQETFSSLGHDPNLQYSDYTGQRPRMQLCLDTRSPRAPRIRDLFRADRGVATADLLQASGPCRSRFKSWKSPLVAVGVWRFFFGTSRTFNLTNPPENWRVGFGFRLPCEYDWHEAAYSAMGCLAGTGECVSTGPPRAPEPQLCPTPSRTWGLRF